jgi:hypothetical protein
MRPNDSARMPKRKWGSMVDLLLDTTYLLPAFGVQMQLEGFEERFPKVLKTYSVSYNPISLVEAKWVILRLGRKRAADRGELIERYRLGLKVLLADERLKQTSLTSEAVERVADGLLVDNGTKDYFDRTIYGTACASNSLLLTEDEELHALKTTDSTPRPSDVVAWRDLAN